MLGCTQPNSKSLFAIVTFAATHLAPAASGRVITGQLGELPSAAFHRECRAKQYRSVSYSPVISPLLWCAQKWRISLWQSLGMMLLASLQQKSRVSDGRTDHIWEHCQAWGGGDGDCPSLNVSHRSWAAALGCQTGASGQGAPSRCGCDGQFHAIPLLSTKLLR